MGAGVVGRVAAKPEMQRTAELLGGAPVLKRIPLSPLEAHDLLERGIPGSALNHLAKKLTILPASHVFEDGIGISMRTVQRLRKNPEGKLDRSQGGRVWQFARVLAKAADVLGSLDEAQRWLEQPALGLDGRKPIDLLSTPEGVEMVETLLGRMDFGVYA